MILVDTSVWIDFLRAGDSALENLLNDSMVLCHPFVIGELACGNLNNRMEVLSLLNNLPEAVIATNYEVMAFIENRRLMARGIGYIDAHLVASTVLTPSATLWTRDRRLGSVVAEMGLG